MMSDIKQVSFITRSPLPDGVNYPPLEGATKRLLAAKWDDGDTFQLVWVDSTPVVCLCKSEYAVARYMYDAAGEIKAQFRAAALERYTARESYAAMIRVTAIRLLVGQAYSRKSGRVHRDRSIAAQDARTTNRIYGHFEWR